MRTSLIIVPSLGLLFLAQFIELKLRKNSLDVSDLEFSVAQDPGLEYRFTSRESNLIIQEGSDPVKGGIMLVLSREVFVDSNTGISEFHRCFITGNGKAGTDSWNPTKSHYPNLYNTVRIDPTTITKLRDVISEAPQQRLDDIKKLSVKLLLETGRCDPHLQTADISNYRAAGQPFQMLPQPG